MSAVNPYAPPQAVVADVHDSVETVQPVRLWSSQGRIGRLRYLAYNTGAYILVAFGAGILAAIFGALGIGALAAVAVGIAMIAYLVFLIFKTIQRSHDMGWSGWTAVLVLIPLAGFIWMFNPGTDGPNKYGAPPPPNTLGVKILGLMLPAIAIIGILAAIALPAYQDYTKRAQIQQGK